MSQNEKSNEIANIMLAFVSCVSHKTKDKKDITDKIKRNEEEKLKQKKKTVTLRLIH